MYEKKLAELSKRIEDECARSESAEGQLGLMKKFLDEHQISIQVSSYGLTAEKNGLCYYPTFSFRIDCFCITHMLMPYCLAL